MVTMFSSWATGSPSALSHWPIWTSVMDSPTLGIFSSTGMAVLSLGPGARVSGCEGCGEQLLLLQLVAAGGTGGGAGGLRPAKDGEREPPEKSFAEVGPQITPGPHVDGLFLHPNGGGAVGESFQSCLQRL